MLYIQPDAGKSAEFRTGLPEHIELVRRDSVPDSLAHSDPLFAPDVCIIDARVRDPETPELVAELTETGIPCIVLGTEITPIDHRQWLAAGVRAIIRMEEQPGPLSEVAGSIVRKYRAYS